MIPNEVEMATPFDDSERATIRSRCCPRYQIWIRSAFGLKSLSPGLTLNAS